MAIFVKKQSSNNRRIRKMPQFEQMHYQVNPTYVAGTFLGAYVVRSMSFGVRCKSSKTDKFRHIGSDQSITKP